MKRLLLAINVLLLTLTLSACGQGGDATQQHSISQNEPEQELSSTVPTQLENEAPESASFISQSTNENDLLQKLSNSLGYDKETGSLSFTIPQDMPEAVCDRLLIGVVGRLDDKPDWSQTWPYFSKANLDGWVAGQTYSGVVQLENVDFIVITMALFDDTPDFKGDCIAKIAATIDRDGMLTVQSGDLDSMESSIDAIKDVFFAFPSQIPYPTMKQVDISISFYPPLASYCEVSTQAGSTSSQKLSLSTQNELTYYLPDSAFERDAITFSFYDENAQLIADSSIHILCNQKENTCSLFQVKTG